MQRPAEEPPGQSRAAPWEWRFSSPEKCILAAVDTFPGGERFNGPEVDPVTLL
jgi:hypothetical protein